MLSNKIIDLSTLQFINSRTQLLKPYALECNRRMTLYYSQWLAQPHKCHNYTSQLSYKALCLILLESGALVSNKNCSRIPKYLRWFYSARALKYTSYTRICIKPMFMKYKDSVYSIIKLNSTHEALLQLLSPNITLRAIIG